jgi:hypothetical protein
MTKTANIFDIGFTLLKTLDKPIYLQLSVGRKTIGNYFQDYFRTELIEICAVMNGAKTNPFFKGMIDGLGKTGSELLHPCPYKAGFINGSGLTFDNTKTYNFALSGTYKIEWNFYSKAKTPLGLIRSNEVIEGGWDKIGRVDLPRL